MFVQQVEPNVSGIKVEAGQILPYDRSFPTHLHTEAEFLQIKEGQMLCFSANEEIVGNPGDIIMINRNLPHSTKLAPCSMYNLFQINLESFTIGASKEQRHLSSFLNENKHPIYHFKSDSGVTLELNRCLDEILSETKNCRSAYEIMVKSLVYKIVGILYRNEVIDDYFSIISKDKLEKIMPALIYMENHYTEEITLEQISDANHLNSQYFSRLFKKITGRNVFDYVTHLRISKAQNMLLHTDKAIVDIAFESGYSSISSFNKSFCKIVGSAPSYYKKLKRR